MTTPETATFICYQRDDSNATPVSSSPPAGLEDTVALPFVLAFGIRVTHVAFSPDGRHVAAVAGGVGYRIRLPR